MATNQAYHGIPSLAAGQGLMVNSSGSGWVTIETDLTQDKDFKEVLSRLSTIEDRLCILQPSLELHDKYPALREAYENYKLIEKLVNEQSGK